MKIRVVMTVLALALAGTAEASPAVSGDGACGVRAVDNESFLTCDGDRAPEPVETAEGPVPGDVIVLLCLTEEPGRVAEALPRRHFYARMLAPDDDLAGWIVSRYARAAQR